MFLLLSPLLLLTLLTLSTSDLRPFHPGVTFPSPGSTHLVRTTWSLDDSSEYGWRRRDDVVLKWANNPEGTKVLFKIHPLTASTPSSLMVSPSNTFAAFWALLYKL